MNRLPTGWTPEQLAAFNDLRDAVEAHQLVAQLMQAAGDSSPLATRLRAELLAHARTMWQHLKDVTPP